MPPPCPPGREHIQGRPKGTYELLAILLLKLLTGFCILVQDMKRNPVVVALLTAVLLLPVIAKKLVLPTVCDALN